MRVLVIVHVEPYFEGYKPDLRLLAKQIRSLANLYDHVINVTCSNQLSDLEQYEEFQKFHEEEWVWGFDAEYYKEVTPDECIKGVHYIETTGHEYSIIEEWMKKLSIKIKDVAVPVVLRMYFFFI